MVTYIVMIEGGLMGETMRVCPPELGEIVSIRYRDKSGVFRQKKGRVEEVLDEK